MPGRSLVGYDIGVLTCLGNDGRRCYAGRIVRGTAVDILDLLATYRLTLHLVKSHRLRLNISHAQTFSLPKQNATVRN